MSAIPTSRRQGPESRGIAFTSGCSAQRWCPRSVGRHFIQMKRRPQMALIHTVSIALLKKLGLHCRFQSTGRPTAPLGSRILSDPSRVFEHNMWDHMQWTPEQEALARQKAEENSSVKVSIEEQVKYDKDACSYWNEFYRAHQNKFFKDRRWLFMEFPELLPHRTHECNEVVLEPEKTSILFSAVCSQMQTKLDSVYKTYAEQAVETVRKQNLQRTNDDMNMEHKGQDWKWMDRQKNQGYFPGIDFNFKIFEVGCGAGNSVFPILSKIRDSSTFLYCCDFSTHAVHLVTCHPLYNASQCHAFVHDMCDEATSTYPFPDGSIDVILLVFVLSSIHPERMQMVINRLSKLLKPGGMILFRDYGRYDLSQLRLKKVTQVMRNSMTNVPENHDDCRCLFGNFYVRGDGTRVYFFTNEEIARIFISAGLKEVQNVMDRRLQVNRKKKVAMHRVWVQCKYQKPFTKDLH
ncbi:LOW QUALITY PROTEIN: mRNA N(3)-methylcytidine methyltransferase METTL8 [Amblyraja radiata]|uniref:LOW QUALITY PROTEIN: mRNA N(3)-methylcytidine methyltransferase METTL8 n=1 Tax=Amblyraja radiata TaxID=386614 RepID=UPI00140257B8|nr:LOW QUALITY PROTEIN: mRNA N(3)-methylcytidine methyltransferase METTL8 [Amblyraja radiata]